MFAGKSQNTSVLECTSISLFNTSCFLIKTFIMKPLKIKSEIPLTVRTSKLQLLPASMHQALSSILLMPQCFGIFPLRGVTSKEINSLKFQYCSARFFYAIFTTGSGVVMLAFCFIRFAIHGLMLDKTATLSFYACTVAASLQFIKIAKNWKSLMREWHTVDFAMKKYGFGPNLSVRFNLMTTLFMGLALFEHILFITNAINATKSCPNSQDFFPDIYFGVAFPHVFTLVPFSTWAAVYVELTNILMTFAWNFTDLFVILLSSSLALRFEQINWKLENNKIMHEHFWREIREDYTRLSRLCTSVDELISPLVIISFINNLFFICVQLYNSIKPRYGIIEAVYFFYSFGFLLGRTIAVTLYGAWINDESRKPLHVIVSIPSEYYCTEVHRFMEQIYSCPVGLTGCKSFMITRGLLLRIAGTIVTFELMLFQFGPLMKEDDQVSVNSTFICVK